MRERVSRTKVTKNLLMNTKDLIFAKTKLQMPFEFSLMKRKVDDQVDKKTVLAVLRQSVQTSQRKSEHRCWRHFRSARKAIRQQEITFETEKI